MPHSIIWPSLIASARSVDSLMADFDENWERSPGGLAQFWVKFRGQRPLSDLSALVKIDLRHRFTRNERPTAADYLAQFPELAEDGDRVLSVVYEEFCLLDEYQANPSVAEFCQRYERWKDSIASQLGYHCRFSQVTTADRPQVRYPIVGEQFASYQLRSILGQGGTAQVYLATDGELGGREVVLKLTPTLGLEPSILASLEHRNIVPIHSVARSEGSALQGICMPYRPGISLDRILVQLLASGPPRRARILWDLLGLGQLPRDQADLAWRDFPICGTYSEGVAWLGLEMAQALAYLHERGVYHRDVKPANILLSARGGPLLIDFNLAHSPHTPDQARAAMSGGTLPYMAPEQLLAFLDPSGWGSVDGKADVYALGLVLREMVTGVRPALPSAGLPLDRSIADLRDRRHDYASSIRAVRPDLPPSLDAIICKCLAFDPNDRYGSAQALADDLQRFLERKPLVGVANPSPVERGINWAYRQRRAGFTLMLMSLVLILGILVNVIRPHPDPVIPPVPTPRPQLAEPSPSRHLPYDALHDPKFVRILDFLESTRGEKWIEVYQELLALSEAHPNSAWPLVYLLQIEQRLDLNRAAATQRLAKIEKQADGEAACLYGLKWAPDLIPLLTMLGQIAHQHHEFDQARRYYNEALLHQPDHPGVKLGLATVARSQERPDEVIELYSEIVDPKLTQMQPINRFRNRQILIGLLLQQINVLLATPPGSDARAKAHSLIDRAEQQLDLAHGESQTDASNYDFFFEMSQGDLLSSRAYLNGLEHESAQSASNFASARDHLDKAEICIAEILEANDGKPLPPNQVARWKNTSHYIRSIREALDRRRNACQGDPPGQPARPSSR